MRSSIGFLGLDGGDLLDAPFVASAFELRREEDVSDLFGELLGDDPRPDRQHVRVVVCTRHAGGVQVVAERGTHPVDLVRRDLLSLTAAAENDAGLGVAARHGAGHRRAEDRIVDRVLGVRSEILDVVTPLLQHPDKMLLERVSGVVTADRNTHPASVPIASEGSREVVAPSK